MSSALQLKFDQLNFVDNKDSIHAILSEDVELFKSILHSYFELRGSCFRQLDEFLEKSSKAIRRYLETLEKKYNVELEKKILTVPFSFANFKAIQEKHIRLLSKIEPEASREIIIFKKSLISLIEK